MYIDYNKIITKDFNLLITEERLNQLKQIAKKERAYLNSIVHHDSSRYILSSKAKEIAYINARHQAKNDIEKALIASNIVFDDAKFAKMLNDGHFDRNSLETFIKLLNYLKVRVINNNIADSERKYLIIADNFAKKLVNHFSKYIGHCEIDIIINKVNELLSFNSELIQSKKDKHTK